jgi:hypothetical protein
MHAIARFGSQATSFSKWPVALRPRLATGLPFRGRFAQYTLVNAGKSEGKYVSDMPGGRFSGPFARERSTRPCYSPNVLEVKFSEGRMQDPA